MKQHMKNLITFLIVLSFVLILHPGSAFAQEGRPIRVGFPNQPGLTSRGENGEYNGYTYDCLLYTSRCV